MQRPALQKCIAVALALLVWQVAAMAVGLDLLLPSPWQVACRLWSVWREPGFFATVAFSLLRISGGFALGLVLGVLLAVAAGRLRVLELLLWPYVTAIKSVPVASFIIICLIWMSTRQLAVFISFLMVFPVIYSNTLQGIKSADGALLEMARVYRVPFSRRLGYIYAPQVKPFLLSGCSVALGMSWKSGVAAEVIGVVGGSIGERLYEAKVYFQMTDLLAWTVVIVVCSVGFEKLVLWLPLHLMDAEQLESVMRRFRNHGVEVRDVS